MNEIRFGGRCQRHVAIIPCEQCAAERQTMTTPNLDLARECGATYDHQWVDEYVVAGLRFTPLQLDAFAERIRCRWSVKPLTNFVMADQFTMEPHTDDVFAAYQQGIRFAERYYGITAQQGEKT